MPKGPAVLGNLMQAAIGRPGRILRVAAPAPGFVELEARADEPRGGWRPGHEVQVRVTQNLSRRYTVRAVHATDAERIVVLAATAAAGPGAAWCQSLGPDADVVLMAGAHAPLRQNGARRRYLGDGCALGTIDAYAAESDEHTVAVEVPPAAVEPLSARWPQYSIVPATEAPGDALQSWLEQRIRSGELAGLDGAVLLGHAQSLQRQRRALIESETVARRAITTKPYWATGKHGL